MKVFGRNLFWYTVVFGTIAAVSRKVVADELQVIDPEGAMTLVVQHTHYMPKRWRGKESSEVVRKEFETLFQVISFPHFFFSDHTFGKKIILIVLDHTFDKKKS
jgi:thioredoxin-related protein